MEEERFEELSLSLMSFPITTCNEEEKSEEQKDWGSLLFEAASPIELRKTRKKEETQAIVGKVSLCADELPQDDVPAPPKCPEFRRPTHLVTPLELEILAEILRANSTHEANHQNERKSEGVVNIQDVINNDTRNKVLDVNVIGETRIGLDNDIGTREQIRASENKENIFCSQASDLGMKMAQELYALSPELPQVPDDVSAPPKTPIEFKYPIHLVTPAEILRANSTHEANHQNERKREGGVSIQDVVISNDTKNEVVDVNVVGETRQIRASEIKENIFCSQASDLGMGMAQELHALSPELPQDDVSAPPKSPVEFEHPTHLLTPSQILIETFLMYLIIVSPTL